MPFALLSSEKQIHQFDKAPSANGNWLATRHNDSTVNVWNTTNPRRKGLPFMKSPPQNSGGNRTLVAFSGVTATMVTVSGAQEADVEFRKFEDDNFAVQRIFKSHVGAVFAIAINSTDSLIASVGKDCTIILYSTELGVEVLDLEVDIDPNANAALACLGLAFSPLRNKLKGGGFSNTLAVCGTDCAVNIWTIIERNGKSGPTFSTPGLCSTLKGPQGSWVKCLTFSRGGNALISGDVDQQLCVWTQKSDSHWLSSPTVLKYPEGKDRSGAVACIIARDALIISGTAIGFVAVHSSKQTTPEPVFCQRWAPSLLKRRICRRFLA